MRMEDDFFSVAMTIPFDATMSAINQSTRVASRQNYLFTFDTEARSSLRDSSKGMFNLDQLSARREDCEGVT